MNTRMLAVIIPVVALACSGRSVTEEKDGVCQKAMYIPPTSGKAMVSVTVSRIEHEEVVPAAHIPLEIDGEEAVLNLNVGGESRVVALQARGEPGAVLIEGSVAMGRSVVPIALTVSSATLDQSSPASAAGLQFEALDLESQPSGSATPNMPYCSCECNDRVLGCCVTSSLCCFCCGTGCGGCGRCG